MLEHLFGSMTRVKLLRLFFNNQQRAYFVRELSRTIDTQLNAVRRELANLEEIGVIKQVAFGESKEEEIGTERSKYYKLNPELFISEELSALLNKTQMLEEREFIELIKKRCGLVKVMIMSGFFTDADVSTDILLVGEIKPVQLAKVIRDFEKFLNRPIRYTVMDQKEFLERKEIGDKFLYSIFESKHAVVMDELKAV
jgi:predicted transcriptional regulator